MMLLPVFIAALLSAVSACTVKNISSDPVKEIAVDYYNNIHIISIRNSTDVWTVLDKEHKTLHETEANVTNSYLMVNKDQFVIFAAYEPAEESSTNNGSCRGTFYKYENGNMSSRVFDDLRCDGGKSFLNRDHHVFVNTIKGVSIIRKGENVSTPISKLSNYTFYHIAENLIPEVFLASNYPNSIHVVTRKKTTSPTPSARRVRGSPGNEYIKFEKVHQFVDVNFYDKIYVVFYNNDTSEMDLKTLHREGLDRNEMTFYHGIPYYGHIGANRQGLFFLTVEDDNTITLKKAISLGYGHISLNIQDCTFDREKQLFGTDSDANIYIPCKEDLLYISHRVSEFDFNFNYKPVRIAIPNNETIESLAMDRNGHVWILAKNLFEVINGQSFTVNQKSEISFAGIEGASPILKVHPDTQEKFIGAESGLYVCA